MNLTLWQLTPSTDQTIMAAITSQRHTRTHMHAHIRAHIHAHTKKHENDNSHSLNMWKAWALAPVTMQSSQMHTRSRDSLTNDLRTPPQRERFSDWSESESTECS